MPELPEIACRAQEMHTRLAGKIIQSIEVLQPKCLNVAEAVFVVALSGAQIGEVTHRGKWIFVETSSGWLLLNLGMGGEILHLPCAALPEKRRLSFQFEDGSCLSIHFWWFGYAHFVPIGGLREHGMTARLGPNATDLTPGELRTLIRGRRSRVKYFLLDQSKLAGIGNAYVHDILFLSGLHPLRTLDTLSSEEIERLAFSIKKGLIPSQEKGGAFYELNLMGERGGFTKDDILIGYREGQPCPTCGTSIEKIKTGSTSSFLCPTCQPLR